MKKATLLAAAVALVGVSSLDANALASRQAPAQAAQQGQEEKKEKVTHDQLPVPVQAALKSNVYKEWKMGDIYKITPATGAESKEVYEVTMTNALGQTGVVRMNSKGGDASKN